MIIRIGERIQELRIRNNMTQSDLARKMRVTRSSVNAWEMGVSIPSTEKIIDLSFFFIVSIDYLVGKDDSFVINISNLDENEKNCVIQLVNVLKSKQKVY